MTSQSSRALIAGLVRSSGLDDPISAIRQSAQRLIDGFAAAFYGDTEKPLDLRALASFRGIRIVDAPPVHSEDAEIGPSADGRVSIRLHPDRPETRRRFSLAHEIAHTFFPDFESRAWARADSRFRWVGHPDDELERLCDIGASELLFPTRWFPSDASEVTCAGDLVQLAATYGASREATLRRFAEYHSESLAAVYFRWSLKPSQAASIGQKDQLDIFGMDPEQRIREARRLRVGYVIGSHAFAAGDMFVPNDKSIESAGSIYDAARTGSPIDGVDFLDLGPAAGHYTVHAVPTWTAEGERGPLGESAVVAVLKPTASRSKRVNAHGSAAAFL